MRAGFLLVGLLSAPVTFAATVTVTVPDVPDAVWADAQASDPALDQTLQDAVRRAIQTVAIQRLETRQRELTARFTLATEAVRQQVLQLLPPLP